MLLPDPHAIWLIALLIVVATRDFAAPFPPLLVIYQVVVWMTSPVNLATGSDAFDFNVRQPSYMFYGALSGLMLTWVMKQRVLLPVHSFVKKRLHVAGPLSFVAVAYGTYALATATGLTKQVQPFGDRAADDPVEIALFSVLFVVLAVLLIALLVVTWFGWGGGYAFLTYRYRDGGVEFPDKPRTRIITEFVLATALLLAPHAFWIYFSRPPISIPQWGAGLITLVVGLGLWVGVYFWFERRYGMSATYFAETESAVTWLGFVVVMASVQGGSEIAYLVAAEFLDTAFGAEMVLIGTSVVVGVVLPFLLSVTKIWFIHHRRGYQPIGPDVGSSDAHASYPDDSVETQRRRRALGLT